MSFEITDAERTDSYITAYLEAESGAGKTFSALLLARGLAGPNGTIGVIDTENGRSKIYADEPEIGGFKHLDFQPPFSPERCTEAFKAAVAKNWDVIIFDSASMEHEGEGGLLDMADNESERMLQQNPNNRAVDMLKWKLPKHDHKRFVKTVLGLPAHIIFSVRLTPTTDMKSKTTILSPVIEKSTKFDLELHCTIGMDHKATWTRIPRPYLPAIEQGSLITVETGARLAGSNSGKPKQAHHAPQEEPAATKANPEPEPKKKKISQARQAVIDEILDMCMESDVKPGAIESALTVYLQKKGALKDGEKAVFETLPEKTLKWLNSESGFNVALKLCQQPA